MNRIMRKNILIALLGIFIFGLCSNFSKAEGTIIDSLTSPDPNIRKYFPRWRICEAEMKIQLHQAFIIMGYDKSELDMGKIEVLAAPRTNKDLPFEILLITCGKATMNANQISNNISRLAEYINGTYSFVTDLDMAPAKRDYCYSEIAPEIPPSESQEKAILNYMEPSDVDHSISLSLFEQSLKIGSTSFWIKSMLGNDQIGYPFWSAGEAKIVLKRPLYINEDDKTSGRIPNLINAYFGAGYRINSGISNDHSALSWVSKRYLNSGPSGKLVAGLDFYMPFHPEAGIQMNIELPFEKLKEKSIEETDFALSPNGLGETGFRFDDPRAGDEKIITKGIAPMLRASGQMTAFYNLWINTNGRNENFFRFDLGLSYSEVREMLLYRDNNKQETFITTDGVDGLKTYKPSEFGDWLFAKVEYRNQANYPFGVSLQYSNQILLGRIYLPILSWLYIEGKYSTPLRGARPYEAENFFMISPVIRITL
jgi:hypothetical protein